MHLVWMSFFIEAEHQMCRSVCIGVQKWEQHIEVLAIRRYRCRWNSFVTPSYLQVAFVAIDHQSTTYLLETSYIFNKEILIRFPHFYLCFVLSSWKFLYFLNLHRDPSVIQELLLLYFRFWEFYTNVKSIYWNLINQLSCIPLNRRNGYSWGDFSSDEVLIIIVIIDQFRIS